MKADGKRYIHYPSRSSEISIWNLSDLHVGSAGCAESLIRRDVDRILKDENSFWLGGGDYADFIGYRDKRFDPNSMADWIKISDLGDIGRKSMSRVRDILWPIRHKCLGLLAGNHETKYQLSHEHDSLHAWLCTELEAPCLGYCALFDIVFCRTSCKAPRLVPSNGSQKKTARTFRVFAHHGSGFATTPGGKLNKLISCMDAFDADIYFLGHVHDQVGRRQVSLGADQKCTKLTHKERIGVISGSYLRTYTQGVTTYGEMKGYKPVNLGAAYVCVRPSTGEMRGEV
jgi:hypothetical protein